MGAGGVHEQDADRAVPVPAPEEQRHGILDLGVGGVPVIPNHHLQRGRGRGDGRNRQRNLPGNYRLDRIFYRKGQLGRYGCGVCSAEPVPPHLTTQQLAAAEGEGRDDQHPQQAVPLLLFPWELRVGRGRGWGIVRLRYLFRRFRRFRRCRARPGRIGLGEGRRGVRGFPVRALSVAADLTGFVLPVVQAVAVGTAPLAALAHSLSSLSGATMSLFQIILLRVRL